MSNDAKEGQHILGIADRLLPQTFRHRKEALEQLKQVITLVSAIGFCLSTDGDLLSQWRGYAEDARGVSIGFAADELQKIATAEGGEDLIISFGPIAYEDSSLAEILVEKLAPIVEHYNAGKMVPPNLPTMLTPMTDQELATEENRHSKAVSELFWMLLRIANYAYQVKSPFFSEEKEWRLISLLTTREYGLGLPGAQFSAAADRIKPFRDFPLKGFNPEVVREIFVGPRNQTPDDVLKLFLSSRGFGHVAIRRSSGAYR